MSRYTVPCETFEHGEAVVGWDAARRTYFCHTFDLDTSVDVPVSSAGTTEAELPSVWALLAEVAAFTTIEDTTVGMLLEDPAREAAGQHPRLRVQEAGEQQPPR